MTSESTVKTAYPIGVCYCGCGAALPPTAFFVVGHDKIAESKLIREEYGSVANFLLAHGRAPEAR